MRATNPARIAVVGAGAIGGWVAARMALAGHDIAMLARGDTLAAIRVAGLVIDEGGKLEHAAVNATGDAASLAARDIVLIAVKAPALADAAEAARPLIGDNTIVVPMLNGVPWWFLDGAPLQSIDPGGRIAAALPAAQVVGCVVHAACSRSAPNRVVVRHADKVIIGEPGGGRSARVDAVCGLLESSGIRAEASTDVRRAIWYKLWGNATINPLSALTRATADKLLADPALRSLMAEAMSELAAVGAAIGCPITESGEDRMAVTARLGAFKPSMLQDVEACRAIELEALLGAPREIAARVGIATPTLDRLYAMTARLADSLSLR